MGREDLGHLAIGAVGDATILEPVDGKFEFRDVLGESRTGHQRLALRGLVVGGLRWPPAA